MPLAETGGTRIVSLALPCSSSSTMPLNQIGKDIQSPSSPSSPISTSTMELHFRPRKGSEGHREIDQIKKTCAHHETLCRQFAECSLQLRQNNAQLEILNETAAFLKARHATIRRQIAASPSAADKTELKRLEEELGKVNQQVQMWMRELEEVNDCRTDLEIRFVKLRSALHKSVTSVQLASIDLDLLENRHADRWKKFLADVEAEQAAEAENDAAEAVAAL